MTDTPLDRIIKETGKALTLLPIAEPERKKVKRAKPPSWDLGERNWNKQIDEILKGKKKAEKAKWPDEIFSGEK